MYLLGRWPITDEGAREGCTKKAKPIGRSRLFCATMDVPISQETLIQLIAISEPRGYGAERSYHE